MFSEKERKHLVQDKGLGWESRGPCSAPGSLWLWGLCLGSFIQTALPSPGVLEPVASLRGSLTANSAPFWAVIPAAVRAQSAHIFKDPASHLGQP